MGKQEEMAVKMATMDATQRSMAQQISSLTSGINRLLDASGQHPVPETLSSHLDAQKKQAASSNKNKRKGSRSGSIRVRNGGSVRSVGGGSGSGSSGSGSSG